MDVEHRDKKEQGPGSLEQVLWSPLVRQGAWDKLGRISSDFLVRAGVWVGQGVLQDKDLPWLFKDRQTAFANTMLILRPWGQVLFRVLRRNRINRMHLDKEKESYCKK